MAKLDQQFNANDVPERDDFSPVPPGQYTGMVVASELKDTSTGGQMIVLEIDIQEGESAGRKIFERLNIKNNNEKAVEIAFRTLGELVKAVGKTTIKDTEELHNKRFKMDVRVEPPSEYTDKKTGEKKMGSAQNSIKKFLPMGTVSPSTSTSAVDSAPNAVEQKSEQKATPPWKTRKS